MIHINCPACGTGIDMPFTLQSPSVHTVEPGVVPLEMVVDGKPADDHLAVCPGPPNRERLAS